MNMTDTDIAQLHPSLGKKNDDTPRVYVACLGCYNEGRLHGKWMDADELDSEWLHGDLHEDGSHPMTRCKKLYHDEWAIHDSEYIDCSEHPDIPKLITVMQLFEEHGDGFREWYNYCPSHADRDNPEEVWQDCYEGEYDSEEAFAEEWAELREYIKDDNPLLRYIDWDWYWNADLRHYFTFSNGHVWSDY
jgi:antirestriction protein